MAKIGEVIELKNKNALVRFGNKNSKIDVSMLENIKIKDKVLCAGKVAIERLEDED